MEAQDFSRVFVIIDALDECSNDDRTRRRLLEKLRTLQKLASVNLMVTSRPFPDIIEEFESATTLEIRASEVDIREYLEEQMSRLPRCVLKDSRLQARIVDGITGAVNGMYVSSTRDLALYAETFLCRFLLAQLHMDSLVDKTTTKAINRALDRLPIGSDALDCAYEDALKRIDMQKQGFSDLAKRTLIWITNAQRLLTITEIRHALAIELGHDDLEEDNLNEIEDIVSACAGLVIVEYECLRLIHFTTLDYLKRHGPDHFPKAQQLIALSCLTYLQFRTFREEEYLRGSQSDAEAATNFERRRSYDTIPARASRQETGRSEAERDKLIDDAKGPESGNEVTCKGARMRGEEQTRNLERYIQEHPFVKYAAYFWASHVEQYTDPDIRPTIMGFVSNDYNVSIAFGLICRYSPNITPYPRQWTGMHLAAYLGLKELLVMLLEAGAEADAKDADNRTPLSWAAERGHIVVVRELLVREDVDINNKSENRQFAPLHFAAKHGHKMVVEQLLLHEDIDVNVRSEQDETPLWMAADHGYELIVEILLTRQDVDVNLADVESSTPLARAALQGYDAIVKPLPRLTDLDLNARDTTGQTSHLWSARSGHNSVVKLLLSRKDINVNLRDDKRRTPLHLAALFGKNVVVETLLAETDIEADPQDIRNETPLALAASHGEWKIVQLLLAREDVNVNSSNNNGDTPLACAERDFAENPSKALSEIITLLRATIETRSSSKTPVQQL